MRLGALRAVGRTESPPLSDRDLARIIRLVYEHSGITLHEGKRALIVARLQKRLHEGGFPSFRDYLRWVEADTTGQGIRSLVEAMATTHTSFFREPSHFEYLGGVALPAMLARAGRRRLEGWCAACATGEEAYTIAMTLADRLGPDAASRVRLLASDLSTRALASARTAVYSADRVKQLPVSLVQAHFDKGLGAHQGLVRVSGRIRALVELRRINLLDIPPLGRAFDFIFCRNVLIYFDARVQQRVVTALERLLGPGGYLFVSHSESLMAVAHGLRPVAPAVYQRRD